MFWKRRISSSVGGVDPELSLIASASLWTEAVASQRIGLLTKMDEIGKVLLLSLF
jgi:hypothetical protein